MKISLLALLAGLLLTVNAIAQSSPTSDEGTHPIHRLAWMGVVAMAALAAVVLKNHIFESAAPSRLRAIRRRDSTEQ